MLPIVWMCSAALGIVLLALPSHAQTVVGVSAPMTGPFAALGREIAVGAKLAMEDINASGGVSGTQLTHVMMDDRCQPDVGVQQAKELVEKYKAVALIGYPCSAVALAVAKVAVESNRLLITLASLPALTETQSQSVLRVVGRQDRLGVFVADLIGERYKDRKTAGLLAAQGSAFNTGFVDKLKKYGIPFESVDSPQKLLQTDVVVVGLATNLAVVNDVAQIRPNAQIVIPSTFLSSEVASIAKNDMIVVANPNPADAGNLEERARKEGVNSPGGPLFYAYAAVQVFAETAKRTSGNFQAKSLFEVARKEPISTVVGSMRFDERGDLADWRFVLATVRPDRVFAMNDVCKAPQCRAYEQCPRDCPK